MSGREEIWILLTVRKEVRPFVFKLMNKYGFALRYYTSGGMCIQANCSELNVGYFLEELKESGKVDHYAKI